jgi:hypothetical protein
MNALVKVPKGAAAALQCMNQTIEHFASALDISRRRRLQWESSICSIGVVGEPRSVDVAIKILRGFVADLAEMDAACEMLQQVTSGHPPVDRVTALSMLNVLFAAIGKRKNDEESAILLTAAGDMFNPVNDVLGCITGVEAINRHPLVLAIAIKQLIATAKFTSCAELREAMEKVVHSIGISVWHLEYMIATIERADDLLFEKDRATWDAGYARADRETILMLHRRAEFAGEGPSEDLDENGEPEYPASPRWLALDGLLKAKAPERKRIAAARKRGNVKRSSPKKRSKEETEV